MQTTLKTKLEGLDAKRFSKAELSNVRGGQQEVPTTGWSEDGTPGDGPGVPDPIPGDSGC